MVEKKTEEVDVEKQFKAANEIITKGGKDGPKMSNADKLKFYALFKQSTTGKCNIKAPSSMQMVAKAKYDAWNALGSMTQVEAKKQFVQQFTKVMPNAKL